MNIEELNYQIFTMQAYKDGKKIMVKNKRYLSSTWIDIDPPGWDWKNFDYKIKEEGNEKRKDKKDLVFCGECVYKQYLTICCLHPKYITDVVTPFGIKIIHGYCETINKDNDCKDFERRDKK